MKLFTEDRLCELVEQAIEETRRHPMRPDGTYNYDTNAIMQRVLKEKFIDGQWRVTVQP